MVGVGSRLTEGSNAFSRAGSSNNLASVCRSALILYRGILDRLEGNEYNNFTKRAYVPKWQKLLALPLAYVRSTYAPDLSKHLVELGAKK